MGSEFRGSRENRGEGITNPQIAQMNLAALCFAPRNSHEGGQLQKIDRFTFRDLGTVGLVCVAASTFAGYY